MKVYLNRIDGIDTAITTMFLSKRTLTKELEDDIINEVYKCTNHNPNNGVIGAITNMSPKLQKWLNSLLKWSSKHITLGRFIDFSFSVYDMHRAGQDDWDSHAKRMDNRIIRSSTRLADFSYGEMSNYYVDKIIPTDMALKILGIDIADKIEHNGKTYIKGVNGYIQEGMENNKDVKRGLYMLSIPSTFVFKINLTEMAHVYKERNKNGTANPEVKECAESIADLIEAATNNLINRELLLKINN